MQPPSLATQEKNTMEKTHPNGNITYTAAAAITRGQPLKFSSGKVTPTTAATDLAIGIALDSAASGDIVPVAILGAYTGTVELKAGGAISAGAQVTAAATATSAATDVIIGVALEAAAASGAYIEIAHQCGQIK